MTFLKLSLVLCFYSISMALIIREECLLDGNFSKLTRETYLMNSLIRKIENIIYEMCIAACLYEKKCKSISYKERVQKCALFKDELNENRTNVNEELSKGWTHAQTDKYSLKNGPICQEVSPCAKGRYEYCEDVCERPGFKCNCKDGYFGETCKSFKGLGSEENSPASSCNEIKQKYIGVGDGFYWIVLDQTRKVYCDMTTIGGGWMMISHAHITDSSLASQYGYTALNSNDFAGMESAFTSGKFLLSDAGLTHLFSLLQFQQIKVYCKKPSVGRTIHIVTDNNNNGYAVRDYILKINDKRPKACNSFTILIDDDSKLSRRCSKWADGKDVWSNKNVPNSRLYNHLMFVPYSKHINLLSNRKECDDFNGDPKGQWTYFVR